MSRELYTIQYHDDIYNDYSDEGADFDNEVNWILKWYQVNNDINLNKILHIALSTFQQLKRKDSIGELDSIQREDFHYYGNNYYDTYGDTNLKWIVRRY